MDGRNKSVHDAIFDHAAPQRIATLNRPRSSCGLLPQGFEVALSPRWRRVLPRPKAGERSSWISSEDDDPVDRKQRAYWKLYPLSDVRTGVNCVFSACSGDVACTPNIHDESGHSGLRLGVNFVLFAQQKACKTLRRPLLGATG
jgi:hypothetical protein